MLEVGITRIKLETYIHESRLKALQHALQEVEAGHIGNYDSYLADSGFTRTWKTLGGWCIRTRNRQST